MIGGTGLNLTTLHSRRDLTRNQLNYSPDNPERGIAIHLISSSTYGTRYRNPDRLLDCEWGVGIFDESHMAKSGATQTCDSLMKIDVPCQIQLKGTPMHHTVGDWVVQTEWLFAQVTDENQLDHNGPLPLNSEIADATRGDITLEEAYEKIKDIAWPWTMRHWGENKDSNGDPLVRIPELVQHDVRLQYTDAEASAMDDWI